MAHDVFISYASEDKPTADAVCAELESAGIRCWIAPRDVLPGIDYSESIIQAIRGTRLLVLVFSASANESPHVMREVERAVSRGIPVIPLRIEMVELSPSMEYYISSPHWLDALTPPLKQHLVHLAETVRFLLDRLDSQPPRRERGAARVVQEEWPAPAKVKPTTAVNVAELESPRTGAGVATLPGAGPQRADRVRPWVLPGLGVVVGIALLTVAAIAARAPGGPAATATSSTGGQSQAVGAGSPSPAVASQTPRPTYRPLSPTPQPAEVVVSPGFAAPGDWVGGIAWDGDNVWVSGGAELFRMDSAGRVLGVFTPPGYSPEGLAWDGSRFWLFTTGDGSIFRFTLDESRPARSPSVGKVIDSPIRTIGGGASHGLAWHGDGLWLSDFYDIYRLDVGGTVQQTLSFGSEVQGVAWDGRQLWIAANNGPLEDASLLALDGEGGVTERYDVPIVDVDALAWTGDAFLVAGAPEFAGEAMVYRVQIVRPESTQ